MAQDLSSFKYLTFDVVGTLIDFESGLTTSLQEIAREAGAGIDPEAALSLYRGARYNPGALRFPDDLPRVYGVIAPDLGLPPGDQYGEQLKASVANWKGFPDSREALSRLAKRFKLIAMTNAQRWALDHFERELGMPFYQSFTVDDIGIEKPDPNYFEQVLAAIAADGGTHTDVLHVAQSQYHDIGISRKLGLTNCWIERRHAQKGYGGTIEPAQFTVPDFHFLSMAQLADAVDASVLHSAA